MTWAALPRIVHQVLRRGKFSSPRVYFLCLDLGYDSPEPCSALSPMSVNRLGESAYQHEMGNLHGHNNLRITRIIKCLALCGLSREARDFRDFAVGLAGTSTVSSEHWDPVINELADELDSDQEDESDSDQELESDSGRELELVDESDSDQELL